MQKRLFKIRMKINQSRKANRSEVELEYKRANDPNHDKKERYQESLEKQKAWKEELKRKGVNEKDWCLLETAESAGRKQERDRVKEERKATFGWQSFTQDATFRAYEKSLDKLPTATSAASGASKASTVLTASASYDPMNYGGRVHSEVQPENLQKLTAHIQEREQSREKFSRRRQAAGGGVDYINDRNAEFNKKIKRSFDKYTVEIRQNLERGTAL